MVARRQLLRRSRWPDPVHALFLTMRANHPGRTRYSRRRLRRMARGMVERERAEQRGD